MTKNYLSKKIFKSPHKLKLLFFYAGGFGNIRAANKFRKKYPKMLFDNRQIAFMLRTCKKKFPCNMLVFGLGWDSLMWVELNKDGRTVFIKDDSEWLGKISALRPGIEAYPVIYPTKISEYEYLLDKPGKLQIKLPPTVDESAWDIILVDGPCGALEYYKDIYGKEPPGRMCSIYMASKLIKKDGDIFVDDCERQVERQYADKYLGESNLAASVKSRTILRWYKMKSIFGKQ